jgi:type I restriction enzyme R subunit
MVGRGTRLLETSKPKPWCLEKDVFLVLDCWDNFEYFKLNPKGKELKPQLSLPVRLVGLRLDKIEKATDSGQPDIAGREAAKLRFQIAALPKESVVIKEAATALARLEEENFWISLTHERLEFLRAEIKPLFRTVSDADFKAMRFERDVLEYSLAALSEVKEQAETIKEDIVERPVLRGPAGSNRPSPDTHWSEHVGGEQSLALVSPVTDAHRIGNGPWVQK